MLSVYIVPAECVTIDTCLTSSRCSRAGTVSSQTRIRISIVTGVEPPKDGLAHSEQGLLWREVLGKAHLSTLMSLKPQSLANLSKCREAHRELNIGAIKRTTGRSTLSKFVVVEYVTLSFGWWEVSGSHRA